MSAKDILTDKEKKYINNINKNYKNNNTGIYGFTGLILLMSGALIFGYISGIQLIMERATMFIGFFIIALAGSFEKRKLMRIIMKMMNNN